MTPQKLRIGYVPEHFSTPLFFAARYFSLDAVLIPFPSGTGHMISQLQSHDLDIAVGLTEGFVTALANQGEATGFTLVGTYVNTPLRWAISTGAQRKIESVQELEGKKIGVSRVGSGSYVMGFVLADRHNWLKSPGQPPFSVLALQTFQKLREAVNDGSADFFLWEHFTSKRYFDKGEIKKIGEINTPWSSWKIAAGDDVNDEQLEDLFGKINQGVEYFGEHVEEAVEYISSQLDYLEADARAWVQTVEFAYDVRGVQRETVERTIEVLKKAGVVGEDKEARVENMIGKLRAA